MENKELAIIQNKILVIRNQQVMIDRDIAELYGVETRILNQAVKRNMERFPNEFCFQLNEDEFEKWKSQFVISNSIKMGLRERPFAFTEQGVATDFMKSQIATSPNNMFEDNELGKFIPLPLSA